MRTPRLSLEVFTLALILPLLLLACGGSDEPADGPSSERATVEPTTEGAEPSPTPRPTVGLTPAATAEPTRQRVSPMSTPQSTTEPPMAPTSPGTDREALVALYSATGGPNWISNDNWLSDRPTGEWEGVTTDINGRVTELDLHSTRLSGEIPPELGNLASLVWLFLHENQLSGEISPVLGNLGNLEDLDFDSNRLSGCVPSSLSGQVDMEYVNLGSLRFCP